MSKNSYFAAQYRSLVIKQRLGLPDQATRVLDVGCDDGFVMSGVAAPLRLGVDMSPRLRPSVLVSVVQASATQLPLLDASFDCVLAFDVLEHIEDDHSTMREMLRVLAPGGAIWFSTPSLEFRMVPHFLTPYTNRSFGHVRNGYTPEQIRALLPEPKRWDLRCFYWNEPLFRSGFSLLHALDRVLPALANRATNLCYQIDSQISSGVHGHLLGVIRHAI